MSRTGQLASVDDDLTGWENLFLLGRLLGLRRQAAKGRAVELIEAFDLSAASARLVKHYSGGVRRRLDIAASIVVTPQLLFLDEPTTGLDPRSRNQIWDIVRALVDEGTTVLLSTQYLEEADQLADGIAVIDGGKVIAEGTPTCAHPGLARDAQDQARPRAAPRLDRHTGHVRADVHLHLRRGHRRVDREYRDYLLPGILVMSVLFNTVYSGVALNTDVTQGRRPVPVAAHLAAIIALSGAVLGLLVGMQLGGTMARAVGDFVQTVTYPWVRLALFVVFAVLAGIVAAVAPARRAAKLDVLTAVRHQ